jgi:DNA-binding transcriptional ArsR family regulator
MVSDELFRNAGRAAQLLGILGNEKRFAIMCHLAGEELSVGTIAERIALSQSALSQHLAKLRALGLVETRRDRQTIFYRCSSEAVGELLATMDHLFGTPARKARFQQRHDGRSV